MNKSILALAMIMITPVVIASEQHREHGAHEHGRAKLDVVQEGQSVFLMLEAAAADVAGFEHHPRNEQQKQALEQAVASLELGDELFAFNSTAYCSLSQVAVDSTLLHDEHQKHMDEDNHHHDHGDHEEHHDDHAEHEEHHDDHTEHEEHHDDHTEHEEHHDDQGHADFHITYEFICDNADEIKQVEVNLFSAFPSIEAIDAQVISASGQQGITLDASSYSISF